MGYIGMWSPKGYGLSAVLVIYRVSILVDLGHFGHKEGMGFALKPRYGYVFEKKPLFHYYRKENQQRPLTNYGYGNLTLV